MLEFLPLDDAAGPHLLHAGDERVHQLVVGRATQPRLAVADVERIGEQVGIISYNETPLKKIILNGITTISTDFRKMGEMVAELVLSKELKHLEVPFHLIRRPSL